MDSKSEKKSLAQLRTEVKELRKTLYKPISRSKKGDLEAEIARHKGISSSSSTKSEAVAVPMVEEQPKKSKTEKAGKKAEAKKVEKKETKSEPKEKKSKTVKKTEKKD